MHSSVFGLAIDGCMSSAQFEQLAIDGCMSSAQFEQLAIDGYMSSAQFEQLAIDGCMSSAQFEQLAIDGCMHKAVLAVLKDHSNDAGLVEGSMIFLAQIGKATMLSVVILHKLDIKYFISTVQLPSVQLLPFLYQLLLFFLLPFPTPFLYQLQLLPFLYPFLYQLQLLPFPILLPIPTTTPPLPIPTTTPPLPIYPFLPLPIPTTTLPLPIPTTTPSLLLHGKKCIHFCGRCTCVKQSRSLIPKHFMSQNESLFWISKNTVSYSIKKGNGIKLFSEGTEKHYHKAWTLRIT